MTTKHLNPDFRWSFSKLSTFEHCPLAFYLEYVCDQNRDDELPNFYSEYGRFAHSLLEAYFKNQIPAFCLADAWKKGYEAAITCPPPPYPVGYNEKAFNAGLKYFETFNGFGPEWETVSVEDKFVIDIDGNQMVGIADLVLRNKESGELWVVDHKSKSKSSMRKDMNTYRHQLYIYAIWCKERFGVWPSMLSFNLFKEGTMVDEKFSEDQLEETKRWIKDIIRSIKAHDAFGDWKPCIPPDTTREPFFCRWVCGVNDQCERYQEVRQAVIEEWKAKRQAEEEMSLGY